MNAPTDQLREQTTGEPTQSAHWLEAFPQLKVVDDPVWRDTLSRAQPIEVPANTVMFRAGDEPACFLFLLDGSVRIFKTSEDGHEIVLYRVLPGQTCILTTSCLITGGAYPATGMVEVPSRGIKITAAQYLRCLNESSGFRQFAMVEYASRINEMIQLLESVAFRRIDDRLAEWLLRHVNGGNSIEATHSAIAVELGTAREVISRQLSDFRRRGLIEMGRGWVEVLNRAELGAINTR